MRPPETQVDIEYEQFLCELFQIRQLCQRQRRALAEQSARLRILRRTFENVGIALELTKLELSENHIDTRPH